MKRRFEQILKNLVLGLLVLSAGCSQVFESSGDPEPACAFVQNRDQERVSWNTNLPIRFRLHRDFPEEARQSLVAAATRWNLISSKNVIEFVESRFDRTASQGYGDGIPTVFWQTTWEEDRSSEQARTTIVWTGSQIRDADIRINAQDFQFSFQNEPFDFRKVDFVSLLVHEMGHALGFAHTESRSSVMFPFLSKGTDRRQITALSDLESYACEYGESIVRPDVLAAAIRNEEGAPDVDLSAEEESDDDNLVNTAVVEGEGEASASSL